MPCRPALVCDPSASRPELNLTHVETGLTPDGFVVFFFTAALFLSGYAIQQRTLRDLRAAIKPKPSPKIILQEQFRKPQDVLMDRKAGSGSEDAQGVTVEVKPTLPEDVAAQQAVLSSAKWRGSETVPPEDKPDDAEPEEPEKPISRAERRRRIKEEIRKLSEGQERGYYQRRLW